MKILYPIAGLVLLDQLTKWWILANLRVGESIELLPNVLITHVKNTGISFGLLQGFPYAMILVMLAVIAILIYNYEDLASTETGEYAMAFVFAGAIGNLIDRLWLGAVTDFVAIGWWPAFNVADTVICVGAILLAYTMWHE